MRLGKIDNNNQKSFFNFSSDLSTHLFYSIINNKKEKYK